MLAAKRGADFELGYWGIKTNKQKAGESGENPVLKRGEKASLQTPLKHEKKEQTFFNPFGIRYDFIH